MSNPTSKQRMHRAWREFHNGYADIPAVPSYFEHAWKTQEYHFKERLDKMYRKFKSTHHTGNSVLNNTVQPKRDSPQH